MTAAQLILGLLTITMSGVVAASVTFRLNIRRDERRFRRQRLEEVFIAFIGFSKQLGIHFVTFVPAMTGKIDYNQALDQEISRGGNQKVHFDQLQMLIALYWPELNPFLDQMINLREKGNDVIEQHKRRYLAGHTTDKESYEVMNAIVQDLGKLESTFSESARKHAGQLRGAG